MQSIRYPSAGRQGRTESLCVSDGETYADRDPENRHELPQGGGNLRRAVPTTSESFDTWLVGRVKERILWYTGFRRIPVWLLMISLLCCVACWVTNPVMAAISFGTVCLVFVWPALMLPTIAFTWWFSGLPLTMLLIKQIVCDCVVIFGQYLIDTLRGKLQ